MAREKSSRRFDLEKIDGVSMRFRSEGGCSVVDSVEKSSGLLIGKKSRPSELTGILKLLTLCDIALRKCGL